MSNVARTCKDSPITTDSTVDAVISATPFAIGVLNEYLIDTCCGGRATIGEAAAHAHVDPAVVVRALQAAQQSEPSDNSRALPTAKSCGCGCR
jgi:iron-sulfur cluster repair protein YtfE (RIC family)